MTVYIVVEITKPNLRPRIMDVFDNPESAVKFKDYWNKGISKDDPYELKIVEWVVKSEFKL